MIKKYYASVFVLCGVLLAPVVPVDAAYHFSTFQGKPPLHVYRAAQSVPAGVTPAQVRKIYDISPSGGNGTIAIIDAYDDAAIEADLNVFNAKYGLPKCTTANGCFEKHKISTGTTAAASADWALEISLDVEWAHAIAPNAKILLVEAKTQSGANLLAAVDYAAARTDVVSVSMSWGGAEFPEELSLDSHFGGGASGASSSSNRSGPVFFAASGDDGTGVNWPAASPYVVGVGGTSLELAANGTYISESAWAGSGGGISAYEKQPDYQKAYSIPRANGMRAIPDVAYNADPKAGFSVYRSKGSSKNGWYVVGGTSAGAPQWAAIQSLGGTATLARMYADKSLANTLHYFRDITSGSNGTCKYYCDARKRYDYVTGLGSPQTVMF